MVLIPDFDASRVISVSNNLQPPDLKRKRSRPSNWWEVSPPQADSPHSTLPTTSKPAAKEEKPSRVDGNSPRSAKGHITQDAERPRRRGRPSLAQVDGNAVAEGEGLGEKKIGRPKNGTKAAENVEEAIEGNGVAPAKKGARKGLPQQVEPPTTQRGHGKGSRGVRNELGAAAALQHEREGRKGRRGAVKEVRVPASSAPEPVKRKRGRPSKTVEELRSKEAAADGGDHPIGTKKLPKPMRGRPSKNELRSEKEQGSESSQHPRTSNPASQYEMQVQDRLSKQRAILEQHRKPTRLASQQHDRTKKRKDHESEDQARAKRQRFEEPSKDVANASEKETKPSYQHLATVTHSVSMQTIEKKWAALPPACIERISQLCQSLLRPVVMHVTDERRKIEASTAVEMVSRRLTNKLSKGIPFPQATRTRREDDFDFENILDHNRLLAAQLMPILHSNELLESELIKQKVLIEQDKEVLTQLETNAKSEAARVKQDERKQHVLVQCQDFSHENDNIGRDIGLNAIYNVTRSVFDLQQDSELRSILYNTSGHMESIQGNMAQIDGLVEAMSRTQAAVQSTLFGHMNSRLYEEVVLG